MAFKPIEEVIKEYNDSENGVFPIPSFGDTGFDVTAIPIKDPAEIYSHSTYSSSDSDNDSPDIEDLLNDDSPDIEDLLNNFNPNTFLERASLFSENNAKSVAPGKDNYSAEILKNKPPGKPKKTVPL